jgi:hypothetical protein
MSSACGPRSCHKEVNTPREWTFLRVVEMSYLLDFVIQEIFLARSVVARTSPIPLR